MDTATFNTFLVVMAVTALIVFIALHFINAGYGMLFDKKWGASLSNRIGWIVMEAPVFIAMIFLWIFATDEYRFDPIRDRQPSIGENPSGAVVWRLKGIAACHSVS